MPRLQCHNAARASGAKCSHCPRTGPTFAWLLCTTCTKTPFLPVLSSRVVPMLHFFCVTVWPYLHSQQVVVRSTTKPCNAQAELGNFCFLLIGLKHLHHFYQISQRSRSTWLLLLPLTSPTRTGGLALQATRHAAPSTAAWQPGLKAGRQGWGLWWLWHACR